MEFSWGNLFAAFTFLSARLFRIYFYLYCKSTLVISLIHSGLAIPFIHCVFDIWVHPISDLSSPSLLYYNTSIRKIFILLYGYIYFFNRVFLPFESIFLKRTSLHPTCISCQAMVTDMYIWGKTWMHLLLSGGLRSFYLGGKNVS